MKIKLAILYNDRAYLDRLAAVLSARYSEKLALYMFTDQDIAMEALTREKIDVFLADDSYTVDPNRVTGRCGFAYFVDSPEVSSKNGAPAVCKFQRAELMYKQILGLFSDTQGETSVRNFYNDSTKQLIFSSPCGGTGTSTLAAACAMHFAAAGKRSLYLSFEHFGGADMYFSAEGSFDMSDVIYTVKSGRGNLPIKLESCVRCDSRGVYYFSTAKTSLDIMELTGDEKGRLVSALMGSGHYDAIILDMDFSLAQDNLALLRQAHAVVWVTDGLPASNHKLGRAFEALQILERDRHPALPERVCMIQNKFSQELGDTTAGLGIRRAGNVPKLRHTVGESLAAALAASDTFDRILS